MSTSGRRERKERRGESKQFLKKLQHDKLMPGHSLDRRHCKTTTTLDISFPVMFLSLILYLTEEDGDGFLVF